MSSMKFSQQNKSLVRVSSLHLVLRVPRFPVHSLRDQFVGLMKNPMSKFRPEINRFHVLNDINFELHHGERVAILGRNGAGKSTLCRCIAGFYSPTRGQIQSHGKMRAFFDTQLGIVPELTGRENAKLLISFIFPDSKKEHSQILEEALEFSELKGFVDSPFRTYSNGMAARLCLSVITARPSEVLILDEVFDGADRFFQEKMRLRMLNAIKKSGAVLFVSHQEEQVRLVANRALVLHQSKIIFDGDVDQAIKIFNSTENA